MRSKEERRGGRCTEATLGQLQKRVRMGVKKKSRKEKKELKKRTVRKIKE